METSVIVWIGHPEGVAVHSTDEVTAALAEVEASARSKGPLLATIRRENGELSVGICEAGWWLAFIDASTDPPYFHSKGDVGAPGDDINFWDGHEGPWVKSDTLITPADGRRAAAEFVESGRLSGEVPWEET